MSQFSHCCLIWMFRSQAMEKRINRIHENTLRLTYQNQNQLTYKKKEKSKTARNLQILATEIYQTKTKIYPEIIYSLFEFTNKHYNLRNASTLKRKNNFTVHYKSESL